MRHLRLGDFGSVRTLTLARPQVHNALNERLIGELTEAISQAGSDPSVRVIVLRGDGPSFCAGADYKVLEDVREYDFLENAEFGRRLAAMYHAITACPQPVVAAAQGSVLGGGAGLVCACDIAIGHPNATVAFSAVRLGIVGAVTAPFVERRLGRSEALHLCLTGRRMAAEEAYRRGFFHYLGEDLDALVKEVTADLLLGSPMAHAATKRVFHQLPRVAEQDLMEWSARECAMGGRSDDFQEGVMALLEKRQPNWLG